MSEDSSTTWVSVGKAAREAGVDVRTVGRWADSGRVPSRRTIGGHRRVSLEDLRAALMGSQR